MSPKLALECVDRLLQEVMGNKRRFGGKVILLGGDFRQCFPVVTRGWRVATVKACVKSGHLWRNFKVFSLTENHRLQGENAEHLQ